MVKVESLLIGGTREFLSDFYVEMCLWYLAEAEVRGCLHKKPTINGFMVEPGQKKSPHKVHTKEQTRNKKRNEEEEVHHKILGHTRRELERTINR